ncbi:hypothetical protein PF010_g9805 [Phytophthora fragariae]|nr:hypothetical protein PF003_g12009 [Phytophthora fragariae]KAE9012327.1 hypothetical protein PF011_g8968 [Phytophthora fragariae]KAE9114144.1 hypothetical protein PF010_g9805 [Phytophthora fragariae]KAE9145826.1 hypothetical protein PF006_g9359 [Phytophthora fragariae]KAE9234267.1 hypothetical protein PF004_g9433 [Phytophthora fragariae]
MAPLALSTKVEAMSLEGVDGLSSSAANSKAIGAADSDMKFEGLNPLPEPQTQADKKKVFRCTFPGCGREFQLKGNLKRHGNIHNGDKQFACKFCGKRFLRKADMEVHYRVHTGEKPYRCKYQQCGKCFARRSDLLSHERTHTGRKPFACAFPGCDRSFARKFDLHKHQRLHEDQPGSSGRGKTKKRKLSPCSTSTPTPKRVDSGDESCDCPSDVAAPLEGSSRAAAAAVSADVLQPARVQTQIPAPITSTCTSTRRKVPATAACVDTPTRPMRYELKCAENHIHSPPACFAALSSLDAFLLSQEMLDLSRPLTLDAFPPHCPSTSIGTSCCPAHLELRPPPPEDTTGTKVSNGSDMLDQLFSTFSAPVATAPASREALGSNPSMVGGLTTSNGLHTPQLNSSLPGPVTSVASASQTLLEPSLAFISPVENGSTLAPGNLLSRSTAAMGFGFAASSSTAPNGQAAAGGIVSNIENVNATNVLSASLVTSNGAAAPAPVDQAKAIPEKVCLSTPASSLLDYSRHNRSCGHLSIQHGNHRDYVVQNHLVCQDSVTRLGELQRASANGKAQAKKTAAGEPAKCASPKDTHRPGCGHLPVRHKDHIDYVVEDNLICQQASWLEDDNLELLGDDFWDFYGAIDAFPTN